MPVTVGPSTLTINYDRGFLISQPNATMLPQDDVGFYASDTRFVSGYGLTLNGRPPKLLDAITVEHFSARYEFMTPELPLGPGSGAGADGLLPEGSIGLRLERTILEGIHEDYDLTNYAIYPVRVVLEIAIESDFADVFDVRNHRLIRRGDLQTTWRPRIGELRSTYRNRTFRRGLLVKVEKAGSKPEYANGRLVFRLELAPRAAWHACLKWLPVIGQRPARTLPCHALVLDEARRLHKLPPLEIVTSHPTLPAIWRQAVEDTDALRMVDTTVRGGVFVPAAGIPWFVTLFGRDSLVVSMESISAFPEFALGALRTLSQVQATDDDAEQDKEPGKIPHEIRRGELASLKLLPFAPYYGTADATPLFIIVLSYAYQWSGDVALLQRYRRNAEAALNWILEYGDRDGDGFQEYSRRSSQGIFNQGWKDSWDAIRHADGSIPEAPIALCELQGYAFDALLRMAEIYDLLKEPDKADGLRERARHLYQRFNEVFWWEAEGTYYLGLDKEKRPMETVASNAGHCLSSGIVPPDRAERVVNRLMADDMWSGWGIRTLSSKHPGYNPYSYHCGSVWPHDNATIAGGFRRAGRHTEAQRVAEGIFAAAERFDAYRLPELFSGLPRDAGAFPVPYLGANVPQAWAAAAVFRLVAILCGIHTVGRTRTMYVNPDLPNWLPSLTLRNLRAGRGAMELHLERDRVQVGGNTTGFKVVHGRLPRPALVEAPLARS
ncbi:MAG TPA: glycogen debranching N-terminal domain-containing protein [Candidatus Dormibacteraeota bacterium]|nr:glycogen debranching N-terminal domain-containing protein [Candidatus Dormibacteraeota bacterium]